MPEGEKTRKRVVDAVITAHPKFVKVGWQGRWFPFILAEEIVSEGTPVMPDKGVKNIQSK